MKRKKKQEKRVRVCVDVVNAGTLVSDRDARRAVAALRTQLRDHFAIVGAPADARGRSQNLQLPAHLGDGFGQLYAERVF